MTKQTSKQPLKPAFSDYGVVLRRVLAEAWDDVSSDMIAEMQTALKSQDIPLIEKLAVQAVTLGGELRSALESPVSKILGAAHKRAIRYWTTHGHDFWGTNKAESSYQDWIKLLTGEQLLNFAKRFPERILHPEIKRLTGLMAGVESTREIDIVQLGERFERITTGKKYWDDLSHTHVSRMWHSDGVVMAAENSVSIMQIVSVMGENTCGVCMIMHGNEIEVDRAKNKIERDLKIVDPDSYVKAWPFPRVNEVQLLSPKEITAGNYQPPFHSRCQCAIQWLRA